MDERRGLRGVVRQVSPGAQYEGTVYDQSVIVEGDDGSELILFDMAPMIGEALEIGLPVEVIVVAALPHHLAVVDDGSDDGYEVLGGVESLSAPEAAAVQLGLDEGPWVGVTGAGGLLWLHLDDFTDVGITPVPGMRVAWASARLDLYGWWAAGST